MENSENKKRPIDDDEEMNRDSEDSDISDEEDEVDEAEDEQLGENDHEVQIEFEGQPPIEADFHGIKNLLHQLFLKAHINFSALANLIIEQNYVGSILRQCYEEDDSEEEDETMEEVFGITTVINLSEHKDKECIKELCKFLLDKTGQKLKQLLENSSNQVALLLNERFINIPPHVSLPLFENLNAEIEEAKKNGKPFNFTHFVLISKLHEPARKDGEVKKKKAKGREDLLWVNTEEEQIAELGEVVGEYSVRSESDAAVSGSWDEEDEQFEPKRRITVFPSNKFPTILTKVKEFLS